MPCRAGRNRHVENVGDPPSADDIVVVEKVATLPVRVDGHVLLDARKGAASGDGSKKVAELRRVEGIAEGQEIR